MSFYVRTIFCKVLFFVALTTCLSASTTPSDDIAPQSSSTKPLDSNPSPSQMIIDMASPDCKGRTLSKVIFRNSSLIVKQRKNKCATTEFLDLEFIYIGRSEPTEKFHSYNFLNYPLSPLWPVEDSDLDEVANYIKEKVSIESVPVRVLFVNSYPEYDIKLKEVVHKPHAAWNCPARRDPEVECTQSHNLVGNIKLKKRYKRFQREKEEAKKALNEMRKITALKAHYLMEKIVKDVQPYMLMLCFTGRELFNKILFVSSSQEIDYVPSSIGEEVFSVIKIPGKDSFNRLFKIDDDVPLLYSDDPDNPTISNPSFTVIREIE